MSTDTNVRLQQIGVLIVDDDPALRRMMTMVLEDEEWTVLEAPDGPEALAMLRGHVSHLIVLVDGRLPTMTGEEVLRAVSADPELMARHAFVMVSGNALTPSPQLARLLRDLGVTVIAKPFSIDELLRIIESQARRLAAVVEQPR